MEKQILSLDELEKSQFNSFRPDFFEDSFEEYDGDSYEDEYDGDSFNAKRAKVSTNRGTQGIGGIKPIASNRNTTGSKRVNSTFTLKITNGATDKTIMLFNLLNNPLFVENSYTPGYKPYVAREILADANTSAHNSTLDGYCYATTGGNIIYQYVTAGSPAVTDLLTISSTTRNALTILNSTMKQGFTANTLRFTNSSTGQASNQLNFIKQSVFGKDETNNVVPSQQISPFQFDNKIIDIKGNFVFNETSGLYFTVNASETIIIDFQISMITR
jgi:hypothetical protein